MALPSIWISNGVLAAKRSLASWLHPSLSRSALRRIVCVTTAGALAVASPAGSAQQKSAGPAIIRDTEIE
jgi:hypothetical protein